MTQNSQTCCSIDDTLEPRFFKALCDPNRIAILARLAQKCVPCTVSQLTDCCEVDISVVSRHLAILRDAGILESEKRGKEVYYSLKYKDLVQTLRNIADTIETCCVTVEDNVEVK